MKLQLLLAAGAMLITTTGCRSELITEADKTEKIVAQTLDSTEQETEPETETPPPPKMSGDAFRIAAHDGNEELVREGIQSGIDVTATDAQGHTALHMAAFNGHSKIIRMLLKAGSQVDERDGEGKTALMHASSGEFPDAIKALLDAKAEVDLVDSGEGFTALMTAAALGQKEVVEILLKHGANKDLVDIDGESAKDFAASRGHDEIVKLLESE